MMNGDVAWLELKRKQADANIILKEYAHSYAEADSKLEKKTPTGWLKFYVSQWLAHERIKCILNHIIIHIQYSLVICFLRIPLCWCLWSSESEPIPKIMGWYVHIFWIVWPTAFECQSFV